MNIDDVCKFSLGFVEMIVTMVKSPRDNGKNKIEHLYTGPQDTEIVEGMVECDSDVSRSPSTLNQSQNLISDQFVCLLYTLDFSCGCIHMYNYVAWNPAMWTIEKQATDLSKVCIIIITKI